MGGLASLLGAHRTVGLDTSMFIYHIEGSSRFAAPAGLTFDALDRGELNGVTTVLTLMELDVKPLHSGRREVADEYDVLVGSYPNLVVANITRSIARRAAEIRAVHRLRPADAIQTAGCIDHGATAFVTNDRDLRRVRDLHVVMLDELIER